MYYFDLIIDNHNRNIYIGRLNSEITKHMTSIVYDFDIQQYLTITVDL